MKSISERDVIFHRRLGNVKDITFDHNKPKKKRPKNRAPITAVELTRRSTLSIRVFLREFCVQLLENCYNPLMYAVKVSHGGLRPHTTCPTSSHIQPAHTQLHTTCPHPVTYNLSHTQLHTTCPTPSYTQLVPHPATHNLPHT